MARTPVHKDHGRPRYQKGCQCPACTEAGTTEPCHCDVCIKANRAYSRRNKRLKLLNGGVTPDELPPTPGIRPERNPTKLVEAQIQLALDKLGDTAEAFPDLAAAALAMGRLLDDPGSGPQHPGAATQLRALMREIRLSTKAAAGAAPVSKLAAMRGGRGA